MSKKTSSAPRPAPKPEPVRQPRPIEHQSTSHPQPGHTKTGTTDWGNKK